MTRGPPAGPRPKPSVSEFLANHQNPMSNPIPNCFVLNNDSYIKEQRFNPGKGIPWQGPKTQLVNPPVDPALLIPAPRLHSLGGFVCFVCFFDELTAFVMCLRPVSSN